MEIGEGGGEITCWNLFYTIVNGRGTLPPLHLITLLMAVYKQMCVFVNLFIKFDVKDNRPGLRTGFKL